MLQVNEFGLIGVQHAVQRVQSVVAICVVQELGAEDVDNADQGV